MKIGILASAASTSLCVFLCVLCASVVNFVRERAEGFEPSLPVLETGILPLDDAPETTGCSGGVEPTTFRFTAGHAETATQRTPSMGKYRNKGFGPRLFSENVEQRKVRESNPPLRTENHLSKVARPADIRLPSKRDSSPSRTRTYNRALNRRSLYL